MRTMGLFLPLLALASCATPETRIRTALTDAGLSQRLSGCMAKRMAHELSLGQLLKLRSLGSIRGQNLTVSDYIRRAGALRDPETLRIVTFAGIGCSLTA